jgi:hypothetical protein
VGELLSIVEDVFELSGRGSVIVVPGYPRSANLKVKVGDPLRLKLPDGTVTATVVGGIELGTPQNEKFIPLMLGPGLSKSLVPVGTEIWLD